MKLFFLPIVIVCLFAISCGESAEEKARREREVFVADSTRKADSIAALLRPRQEVYAIAIGLVKDRLKVPSSARIAAVSLADGDSLSFKFSPDSTTVEVEGAYESQNLFGVYLPGRFYVQLKKDSTGAYAPPYGIDGLDIRMN